MASKCIFCALPEERIVGQNPHFILTFDQYPVPKGHMLIIPKRHIQSFFELKESEILDLFLIISSAKAMIESKCNPDAYNIGVNDGKLAGQTVMHLHIHLIPRYKGDVVDFRGGIRWVLPEKANYWDRK